MILIWSRRIRWALVLAVLVYVAVCGYFWSVQRDRIFLPDPFIQSTPARLGMKYEAVNIPSGSGKDAGELYTWWIPAEASDAPTLLYLHGSKDNVGRRVEHIPLLHNAGFNLLLADYRGYGKSTGGNPSEAKVYEDAESAWRYLTLQRKIAPKNIYIYGHSLGGAIAIELGVRHPNASGVIAESTFTSMMDMADLEYAYLPVDLLLNQRFDSMGKIRRLKVPLLLIHGTWDKRVPYQMSQRLFESALEPKSLKLIEGGEHGNSDMIAPLEYGAAITEFIRHSTAQPR